MRLRGDLDAVQTLRCIISMGRSWPTPGDGSACWVAGGPRLSSSVEELRCHGQAQATTVPGEEQWQAHGIRSEG